MEIVKPQTPREKVAQLREKGVLKLSCSPKAFMRARNLKTWFPEIGSQIQKDKIPKDVEKRVQREGLREKDELSYLIHLQMRRVREMREFEDQNDSWLEELRVEIKIAGQLVMAHHQLMTDVGLRMPLSEQTIEAILFANSILLDPSVSSQIKEDFFEFLAQKSSERDQQRTENRATDLANQDVATLHQILGKELRRTG